MIDNANTITDLKAKGGAINIENGVMPTREQDNTAPPVQFYLMKEEKTDIGIISAEKGATDITVTTGHGFTAPLPRGQEDWMVIWENNAFEQVKVIGVAGHVITITTPLPFTFSTNAVVVRGKIDLNLNGALAPVVGLFKAYGPNLSIPFDIIAAKVIMLHSSAGDKSKYGNQTILDVDKGTYFRQINGSTTNLGTYENNQDFEEFGWHVAFDDKAGGGNFSTVCQIDTKEIFGTAIRVDPRLNEQLDINIRGDLTGLTRHRVAIYGHFTQGE
jgi:hypothetical protein